MQGSKRASNGHAISQAHAISRWIVTLTAFFLWVGVSSQASALSVLKLSEKELVSKSNLIVQGHVKSKRCVWAPRKMGVVTLVTITVNEEVVGRKAPKEVVVRHYGGQIGDVKVVMPLSPNFEVGQEVIVVLEASKYLPSNEYLLVGWTQGQWHVLRPSTHASFSAEPVVAKGHFKISAYPQAQAQIKDIKALTSLRTLKSRLRQHWQEVKDIKHLPLPSVKLKNPTLKLNPISPLPKGVQQLPKVQPSKTVKP